MNKYLGEGLGKVMILNLKRGDLLLETIEEELEKSGVQMFSSLEEALACAGAEKENVFTYVIPAAMSIVTKFVKGEE